MIECTKCNEVKEVGEFSPQKTNPAKLYRWCDECRKVHGSLKTTRWDFKKEMEELRRKGRESRKFGPEEAREIRILAELGQGYDVIANQYSVHPATITKVVKGQGCYAEI
ncbi:helix-turn-helix DNA binding domain protein [Streptomyces phage Patelgo]|nr:helix-turn-helix DNA binding domain protein [Streptomyces phage Patelgo]